MAVNCTGVFLGTAAAVRQMQKNGGGSIVNLSSISGVVGQTHGAHELQRLQRRGADHDQVHRRAVRQGQHPLQFGPSRADAADAHLGRHRRSRGPRQNAASPCRSAEQGRSTRSPTRSCSWRRTRRPTSPARNFTSTAAIWRCSWLSSRLMRAARRSPWSGIGGEAGIFRRRTVSYYYPYIIVN